VETLVQLLSVAQSWSARAISRTPLDGISTATGVFWMINIFLGEIATATVAIAIRAENVAIPRPMIVNQYSESCARQGFIVIVFLG